MSFSHRDPSTSEADWTQAGARNLSEIADDAIPEDATVIVLAAHPDDEALGAASLLARLRASERNAVVILFTAGEGSHPESPTYSREELKAIRLREFHSALDTLGGVDSRFIGLPDGRLGEFSDSITREITKEVERCGGPVVLVSPYSRDGHGDHEAVGAAALGVGRAAQSVVLEYPIWFWHWADPAGDAWRSWKFLPDPAHLDRQEVFDCYQSQVSDVSDHPGDEAILSSAHLEHFDRGGDTFAVTDFGVITEPACDIDRPYEEPIAHDARTASAVFDDVHAMRQDPWSVWDSEYERAKRRDLIRHLRPAVFAHTIEIGCSVGALSHDLAQCSRKVTAVDASAEALAEARSLSEDMAPNIDFVQATVPFEWPPGQFDCVVLSETGFYMTRSQLQQTLRRIQGSTPSRFVLVLCHWRGDIRRWPLSADEVHRICLEHWPEHRRVFSASTEYRLDIVAVDKREETHLERARG